MSDSQIYFYELSICIWNGSQKECCLCGPLQLGLTLHFACRSKILVLKWQIWYKHEQKYVAMYYKNPKRDEWNNDWYLLLGKTNIFHLFPNLVLLLQRLMQKEQSIFKSDVGDYTFKLGVIF